MKRIIILAAAACSLLATTAFANGGHPAKYKVTITNLTKGQFFTPALVVTHHRHVSMFTLGEPASDGLAATAEAGDTSLLLSELMTYPNAVGDYATVLGAGDPPLLAPGETASVTVAGGGRHRYLSLAGMLLPTNDTFVALNSIRLPTHKTTKIALAYDAGTEVNDQNCTHIPGPRCGGEASSAPADTDEGYVYVSNGIHMLPQPAGDVADKDEVIGPHQYDWRNPVARIVVQRLRY